MSNSVCRVCLLTNLRMFSIGHIKLLEVYEKLASTKLNADNGMPHTICYLCLSQLQKCTRFSDIAHKSEQILTDLLHNGIEITHESVMLKLGIKHGLSMTDIQFMSLNDNLCSSTPVTVKEEEVAVKEETTAEEELYDIEDKKRKWLIKADGEDYNIAFLLEENEIKVTVLPETKMKEEDTKKKKIGYKLGR